VNNAVNNSKLAVLEGVLSLLEHEYSWTKDVSARDDEGNAVASDSPEACRWCLSGAIDLVANQLDIDPVDTLIEVASLIDPDAIYDDYYNVKCDDAIAVIADYNDAHDVTHGSILDLVDEAIEELQK